MSSFPFQRLFREMKRRKVFRVAGVYAVVAWALIEVADTAAPLMAMPPWAPKIVLFLALFGFPVALVLAWAFETSPEGVKRTEPAASSSPPSRIAAYSLPVSCSSWLDSAPTAIWTLLRKKCYPATTPSPSSRSIT